MARLPVSTPLRSARHRTSLRQTVFTVLLVAVMFPLSSSVVAADDAPAEGGPGNASGAARTEDGWIMVPTHPVARTNAFAILNGITHDTIEVVGDAPFYLRPAHGTDAGVCLIACVQLADFDITFLMENGDGSTTLLSRFAATGDESGRTPAGASIAIVYLRTPGSVPESLGYRFEYIEGDSDASEAPDL